MADAFARGEPVPHGGERPEPNPLFLAHAAGLSELYVLLATQAPIYGLRLRSFRREGDAHEPFRADGRGGRSHPTRSSTSRTNGADSCSRSSSSTWAR